MKTPEEIKMGLAACSADECHGQHEGCTYQDQFFCTMRMCGDALAYIQNLESRLVQVERERDAAVADLESVDEKYEILKSMIDDVTFNHEPYSLYLDFRSAADEIVEHEHADVWRGVCEENTKEES